MDSFTIQDLCGNPHLERMEVADVGGVAGFADEQPLGGVITWDDVDAMAAEAERHTPVPDGHKAVLCQACNGLVFIPANESGDVLCDACQSLGEVLASLDDDDDPDPTTPGGAALPLDALTYPDSAARYTDGELIMAITIGDEEPEALLLDEVRRQAWLSAMTTELIRRLDGRQRLAA